jgi:hypothetical protein
LPKKDLSELQLIFAKHVTRKLDSGLTFSFQGQKYQLPLYVGNIEVPAAPHDTVTVATSSYIGIKVLFKYLVMTPEPITSKTKEVTMPQSPQKQILAKNIPNQPAAKTKNKSPWFGYNQLFVSKHRKDDISAAELST